MNTDYKKVTKFHGHSCPGLAMGYRMTIAAMNYLGIKRAEDEELFAISENKACGVDALQYISGCTLGKGNLNIKDYGKMVYIFYCRSQEKAIRVKRKTKIREIIQDLLDDEKINWILHAKTDEIIDIKEILIEKPDFASYIPTVICDICGETMMITKMKKIKGKKLCIPCYNRLT